MDVNGNATIKSGNEDYLTWQAVAEDGTTPIDLSVVTLATLRLKNAADSVITEFKTSDSPQKFFITDAANGTVQLRPAAADFPTATTYSFDLIVTDSIGTHNVPNSTFATLTVLTI